MGKLSIEDCINYPVYLVDIKLFGFLILFSLSFGRFLISISHLSKVLQKLFTMFPLVTIFNVQSNHDEILAVLPDVGY